MRDSFVLVFLIVLMVFLAYLARQVEHTKNDVGHLERRVDASPYVPRAFAVKGNVLIPPPPPYTVAPENP